MTLVIPTDRPKSVRNRCVIELFVAFFVLSLCPFATSVGVGAFVIGLSQISSFFSFTPIFFRDAEKGRKFRFESLYLHFFVSL